MRMGSSKTGVEKQEKAWYLGTSASKLGGSKVRSHDDSCAIMAKG